MEEKRLNLSIDVGLSDSFCQVLAVGKNGYYNDEQYEHGGDRVARV